MKNTNLKTRRIEALNASKAKAAREYDLYRVEEITSALNPTWDVTRFNDAERSYSITVDEYDWSCTCPACKRDTHCKHIEVVRLHIEEMNALEARAEEYDRNEEAAFFMAECQREVFADVAGAWS